MLTKTAWYSNGWWKVIAWVGSILVTFFVTYSAISSNNAKVAQILSDHLDVEGIHETQDQKRARIQAVVDSKLVPINVKLDGLKEDMAEVKEGVEELRKRR